VGKQTLFKAFNMSMLEVYQFPCLTDNFGYLVRDKASGVVAAIDSPEADVIAQKVKALGLGRLDFVLNTHWHPDHAGGNAALKARFGCAIYGPAEVTRLAPLDQVLKSGDHFMLGQTRFDVLDLSGHTMGMIGYYCAEDAAIFSGDCLFPLGCGRMFEGTPAQFWRALLRMAQLPPQTLIYGAHEYALSNLKFAESVGISDALKQRGDHIRTQRAQNTPTVPTTVAEELATNPFLVEPLKLTDFDAQAARFGEIRALKDRF
jgi:hydroxyacylglutathione hydrolase